MGRNQEGQLGVGDATVHFAAKPLLVSEGFASVKCGSFHCAALTTEGRLFTWGSGAIGQGMRDIAYQPCRARFQFEEP